MTKTVKITRCYHECLHFGIDGGPSGAMVCHHPEIEKQYKETGNIGVFYIISHPDCDDGFPPKCPLLSTETGDESMLKGRMKVLGTTRLYVSNELERIIKEKS